MSKGLDPDQNQRSVGPDLGPNRLQRLSAIEKQFAANKERDNYSNPLSAVVETMPCALRKL